MSIEDGLGALFNSVGNSATKGFDNLLTGLTSQAPVGTDTLVNRTRLIPEYTLFITCQELGIYFKAALPPSFNWGVSASYSTPLRELVSDAIGSIDTFNIGKIGQGVAAANGIQLVTQALTARFWTGSSTSDIQLPVILQAESNEIDEVMAPLLSLLSLSLPRLTGGRRGGLLQAPGPHFDLGRAFNNVVDRVKGTNTTSVAGVVSSGSKSFLGGLGQAANNLITPIQQAYRGATGLSGSLSALGSVIGDASEQLDSIARSSVKNQITMRIGNYIQLPSVVITNVEQQHFVQPVGQGYGVSTGNMQRIELSVSFQPFMDITQDDLPDIFINPDVARLAREMIGKGTSLSATGADIRARR